MESAAFVGGCRVKVRGFVLAGSRGCCAANASRRPRGPIGVGRPESLSSPWVSSGCCDGQLVGVELQQVVCGGDQSPLCSAELLVRGSGQDSVDNNLACWALSDAAGTSRAVFGAFAQSVYEGADPLTGGPVQLVGLRRVGSGISYGRVA